MPLTEEQKKLAHTRLRRHLTRGCPVCGQRRFRIADMVNFQPVGPDGQEPFEDSTIPVVLVVCQQCNYLLPFAAMALGLWDDEV